MFKIYLITLFVISTHKSTLHIHIPAHLISIFNNHNNHNTINHVIHDHSTRINMLMIFFLLLLLLLFTSLVVGNETQKSYKQNLINHIDWLRVLKKNLNSNFSSQKQHHKN